MKNCTPKSPGRLVAESIARATGTEVQTVTVKMRGSKDVERFIKMIQDAGKTAHLSNLKLD